MITLKNAFLSFVVACWLVSPALAQGSGQAMPTVVVKPAEKREISRRNEFIGRIEAVERVEVRARVTGTLLKPKFEEGQRVTPGQVLYEIEPASFQADVDSKKAQVAAAKADAQNADVNLDRAQELLRSNAGTRATFDLRKAEAAKADAAVQIAEAALENAKITLGYTKLSAPISGRIGRTAITEGNIVSPSSGPLTTIVKDEKVRAVFSVSQREILEYRKSAPTKKPIVKLKMADGSEYPKTGTVDYIDNAVDARTDSQVLRGTFDNPDGHLTHDQTIRVLIEQPAEGSQVVVSQAVLSADQSGTFVLIVDNANKVAVRYIKTAQTQGGVTAVTEGLKEGELVIVQGGQRVRPGMQVNVQQDGSGK